MPDDTVKNINLAIPSTPIQEHPQNVTVVPKRRKKRGSHQDNEDLQQEDGPPQSSREIEDRVTITNRAVKDQEKDRSKKKLRKDLEKEEIRHIDIKV